MSGTVLVVDDHPGVGRALAAIVRVLGVRAEYVDGGVAALAYARANPVDLVLLDYMMPDVDGLAVLAALRADPRTRGLPVVVCSAVTGDDLRERAAALGALAVLDKGKLGLDELRPWVEPGGRHA